MLEPEIVVQAVKDSINKEINPGDQPEGSDHLSSISVSFTYITPNQTETGWEVDCEYIITVENEFTIYPDNPPREDRWRRKIILDQSGNQISETKEHVKSSGGYDIDSWLEPLT